MFDADEKKLKGESGKLDFEQAIAKGASSSPRRARASEKKSTPIVAIGMAIFVVAGVVIFWKITGPASPWRQPEKVEANSRAKKLSASQIAKKDGPNRALMASEPDPTEDSAKEFASLPMDETGRYIVPGEEAQIKASKAIQERLAEVSELFNEKPSAMISILLSDGTAADIDLVERYVLLRKARNLAEELGDDQAVAEATEELQRTFAIEPPTIEVTEIADASTKTSEMPAVDEEGQPDSEPEGTGKAKIPERTVQSFLLRKIKDEHATRYKSRDERDKLVLANLLKSNGSQPSRDPNERYVLLTQARDLATDLGNAQVAFSAIDELAESFAIDTFPQKMEALRKIGSRPRSSEAARQLLLVCFELMERAIDANELIALNKLKVRMSALARRIEDEELLEELDNRIKTIRDFQKFSRSMAAKALILETNPDDPGANHDYGRFLGFYLGDWETGLPMLAKSADENLRRLAKLELSNPTNPLERLELADGWWKLAEVEQRGARMKVQLHAAIIYRAILPSLATKDVLRVQHRIDQMKDLLDIVAPPARPSGREVALWVLENDGFVTVIPTVFEVKPQPTKVNHPDEFPKTPFIVTGVFFGGTDLTDAQIVRLLPLTKLTTLDIGETRVTDVGIFYVTQLTSLRQLSLRNDKITDAGLEQLTKLKYLRQLVLTGTQVTQAAVKKFEDELLNCQVVR